jgi:methionyl aminopeptidase
MPLRPSAPLESKCLLCNAFRGFVNEDLDCSHYMKDFYAQPTPIRNPKAKALLTHIENNYSTLAFCRKWVD